MSIVTVSTLSHSYGNTRILTDVSFTIPAGTITGILGANGAGKSTLLALLAGILPVQAGSVDLHGKPIASYVPSARAREIAYLPQQPSCEWPLSVERVVMLGRIPYLSPLQNHTEKDAAAVTLALQEVDALHLRKRNIQTLSGGEQARVMLARALAGNPKLMLVDEPVASLDIQHQLTLMQLLKTKVQGGMAVVVVLHDMGLAARFCENLLLLHQGGILAQGKSDEVLTDAHIATALKVTVTRILCGDVSQPVPLLAL